MKDLVSIMQHDTEVCLPMLYFCEVMGKGIAGVSGAQVLWPFCTIPSYDTLKKPTNILLMQPAKNCVLLITA